jgi:thiol-disulfide isomerase/thioredoxin
MKAFMAAIASLLVLTGCGQTGAGTLVNSGDGSSPGSRAIPITERQPLPELSGTTLQGDSITTTDFIGEIVVINLWGSWCGPCRAEAPVLRDLAMRTQDEGVQFIGLNTRDKMEAAQAFERKVDMPYPSLVDEGGSLTARTNGIVPINAIPSTIVVDRDGKVSGIVVGETSFSQLRELIRAADPGFAPATAQATPATATSTEDSP